MATHKMVLSLCTGFILACGMLSAQESWETRRVSLGTEQNPYRILVDKVLMKGNGWSMTPGHVQEIRDAGFNVVVPRIGADENDRVTRVARMAMDAGMFYMPWIRGTRVESGDPKQRATDHMGRCNDLASPNSDVLWDYWRDRILFYAELSRDVPSVMGVFLDFENYDKLKIGGGMCYTLSYDEPILLAFCEKEGLDLPAPLPPNRAEWLEKQGVADAFKEFQVGEWRRRARELRSAIDECNPHFQFVVYPASQSLFIREAIWGEWHTKKAPLIMAEVETYWRHEFELGAAMNKLKEIMLRARTALDEVDPTIRYMAGLDPVVRGANPEFEGKSAVLGAEFGNGYWVFYEGPKYDGDHPEHFRWFKRANDAIAKRDFSLWRQPAETPNPMVEAIAKEARAVAGAKLKPFLTAPLPEGALEAVFTHRPGAKYQVLLKKGEHLRGSLIAMRHAHITNGSVAVVVTPSGGVLGSISAPCGTAAAIDMVAPEDGVYGIAVTSGRAKGRLKLSNRYVCIAGPRISLVDAQPTAFVLPKGSSGTIDLSVRTYAPGEHVQVTFRSPDGAVVFDGNTRNMGTVTVSGDISKPRRAWKLDLIKAVEDIYVDLGKMCEPRMATHPGRMLVNAEAE